MVSFVCDTCQETLKKNKLEQHTYRCRQYQFSCIDCFVTFTGTTFKQHSSCISEEQKVQGKLFKQKEQKNNQPKVAKPQNNKEIIKSLAAKVDGDSLITQIEAKLSSKKDSEKAVVVEEKKRKTTEDSKVDDDEKPLKKSKKSKNVDETAVVDSEKPLKKSKKSKTDNITEISKPEDAKNSAGEKSTDPVDPFSKKEAKKLSKKILTSIKSIMESSEEKSINFGDLKSKTLEMLKNDSNDGNSEKIAKFIDERLKIKIENDNLILIF